MQTKVVNRIWQMNQGFYRGGGPPPVSRRGPPPPVRRGGGGNFNRGPPAPVSRGSGRGLPPPVNRGGGGGFGGPSGRGPPNTPNRFGGGGFPPQNQPPSNFGGPAQFPPPNNNNFNAAPPNNNFNNFGGGGGGAGGGGGGHPGDDMWLHKTVTGDMAMDVLEHRPVGTYLFRPSATPGFLTLSFKKEGGEVYHVRITQQAGGYLNDGDPRVFPTLEALAKSKPRTLKTPILAGQL